MSKLSELAGIYLKVLTTENGSKSKNRYWYPVLLIKSIRNEGLLEASGPQSHGAETAADM